MEIAPDEESFYLNLAGFDLTLANREGARESIERLLARRPASKAGLQALRELERR